MVLNRDGFFGCDSKCSKCKRHHKAGWAERWDLHENARHPFLRRRSRIRATTQTGLPDGTEGTSVAITRPAPLELPGGIDFVMNGFMRFGPLEGAISSATLSWPAMRLSSLALESRVT
jgi:hypothetical protein